MITKKDKHYSHEIYAILSSMGVAGSRVKAHMERFPEKNPLNGIDIEAEYALIKEKRSTLPRHKRDLVCFVHDNYEEIQKSAAAELEKEEKANAAASEIPPAQRFTDDGRILNQIEEEKHVGAIID